MDALSRSGRIGSRPGRETRVLNALLADSAGALHCVRSWLGKYVVIISWNRIAFLSRSYDYL